MPKSRLHFTNGGVGVGSRNRIRKQSSVSEYDSVVYDQVKTRLSRSKGEAEELNQLQSVETCIVIGLSFRFCFRRRLPGFH